MEIGGLVGQIPSSISSLKKLFFIDLDFNGLTGEFFCLVTDHRSLPKNGVSGNHHHVVSSFF